MGTGSQRLLCPTLIARDDELAALAELLAAASRGSGGTILIGGDAGVGKTALGRRFADNARSTASRVLVGECTEIEARRPLGPFLQIVEDARRSGLIRVEDAQRVAPMPQGEIDASTRPRLYQGLVRIFAGVARTAPLVLVIEDLHWADEATLELFRYLPRHVRTERIVLIGTYRTDELTRRHPLRPVLTELTTARLARTLELGPLDRAATARVIRETLRLPRDVPQAFRDAVHDRCEGNPFFIEEVLDAMRARGTLRYRDGAWVGADEPALALPESIRDAVQRRLDVLPDEARRILRIAAVIGQRFDFYLLSLVAEVGHEELVQLIRSAIEAQLVVEPDARGSFAFRHALTRESVLAELLEPEQRAWHRAIGLAIESDPSGPGRAEELAYHFDAGGERERAFRYRIEAAAHARSLAAFTSAVEHLQRAIALAGPDEDVLALYAELAQAEAWVDPARGERAWQDVAERALAARRPLDAGQALAYVGALQVHSGAPRAFDNLTRAIELLTPLGATKQIAHAYDYLAQWHLFSGEREPGMKAAARAIEVAEALGARMRALNVRVTQSLLAGDDAAQMVILRRAIDEINTTRPVADSLVIGSGPAHGPTGPLARFYSLLHTVHTATLSPERNAVLKEWRGWAEKLNFEDAGGLYTARAEHALGAGDFDEVMSCVAERGDESSYTLNLQLLEAFVRVARDGPEAANSILARMRAMTLRPGAANAMHREIGQLHLLRNDFRSVLSEPGASPKYQNYRIGKAVITALFASRALVDGEASTHWYAVANELRDRTDFPRIAALYADAERATDAGETASATDGLAAVAVALDHVDAPAIATQLRLRRALLLRPNAEGEANAELARVVAFWRTANASWYLTQLEKWAREHGFIWAADATVLQRATGPGAKPLTERELEVARMVALGLTNKDIADRLVISERTAEGHVQRILDKLGFRSRSQIAAWHASGRAEVRG